MIGAQVDIGGLVSLVAVVGIVLLARSRGKSLRAAAHAAAFAAGVAHAENLAAATATAVQHVHIGHSFGGGADDTPTDYAAADYDRSISGPVRQPLYRDSVGRSLGVGDLSDSGERGQLAERSGHARLVLPRRADGPRPFHHDAEVESDG